MVDPTPNPGSGVVVHGGPNSTSAVLEELTGASLVLKSAANSLTGYQAHLGRAHLLNLSSPPPRIVLLAPWWGAALLSCASALLKLQAGATKTQAQALLLAEGLSRAEAAYRKVELEVARKVNHINKYPALARSLTAILTGNRPTGKDTETVLENMPSYAGDLLYLATPFAFAIGTATLGPGGGMVLGGVVQAGSKALPLLRQKRYGGLFDRSVADRLYGVITKTGGDHLELAVEPVKITSVSPPKTHTMEADVAGVLKLVPNNEGHDAGSITLTTHTRPDGTTHTIVGFPGTEGAEASKAANGKSPFGVNGLAESTTLGSQHVNAGVMTALEQAGVPAGAAITLVGFSQGGKHAMNLAADPRFAKKYQTNMVITAGSPVAQTAAQVPAQLKTLHLEHEDDPVPGLDGAVNPHSINRITLGLSGYEVDKKADTVFGAGHDFDNYVARVESADLQNVPDLAAHRQQLAQALGTDEAVEVETVKVKLRHVSAPDLPISGIPSGSTPRVMN